MRSRLAIVVALLLPTFLYAAIPLGVERPVTTPGRMVAAGPQGDAEVATSGNETLVAWIDSTPGRQGAYVAALGDDGSLIEGTQRLLSSDADWVQVTWSGQSYLAFWWRNNRVTVVSLDGNLNVLTTPRVVRTNTARFTSSIVWAGNRGAMMSGGRALLLFDRQGTITGSNTDINPGGTMSSGATLATDGETFFTFWEHATDVRTDFYVRRFNEMGVARDAARVPLTVDVRIGNERDVAFGGGKLALVAANSTAEGDILRSYLIDPETLEVDALPSRAIGNAGSPRVEWIGDRFVALWFRINDSTSSLQTLAINADGTTGNPVSHATHRGVHAESRDVWNGHSLIVTFTRRADNQLDIYAAAADWRGEQLPHTQSAVALSPSWQAQPAMATNGQQSLIVWTEGYVEESEHGNRDLLRVAMAHVTAGIVDSPVVYLSQSATWGRPAVVFTGSIYIVSWLGADRDLNPYVMMQRVSTTGEILDPEPVTLAPALNATLAWNGTHALLAWSSANGLHAKRLTRDGVPVDTTPLQLSSVLVRQIAATSNGSDFFLTWSEGDDIGFETDPPLDLYAARIDASGIASRAIPIATGPADQGSPAIASDGRDALIAYIEDSRLVQKKLLREGALDGTTAASPGVAIGTDSIARTPTIASNGKGYVLAWETGATNQNLPRVVVAGLDRNGVITDAPVVAAESELHGMWPMLATAGGNRGDLAYGVLQPDEAYGSALRLFVRRLGESQARGRATRH
ncbi:MAG TPA: hypothetical protein VGQ76_07420 [Thermoanaerobaculia bacterium]|jgi:hypothetical protein|nr:hypothetical protein [Thermoanaerobaculia bacterium]